MANPKETDQQRDEALEETFPASDPPSIGGSTGPNDNARPRVAPEPLAQEPKPAQNRSHNTPE